MTREQLQRIGDELIQEGRIVHYLVEEAQTGELRLLVCDAGDTDYASLPLQPAD